MSWYKNKFDPSKEDTGIDFGGTHNNPGFAHVYELKFNTFINNMKPQFDNVLITNKFIYE